jgi:uncharacterized protein YkwD
MRHAQLLLISLTLLLLGLAALGAQAASPMAQVALPMLGCPGCYVSQATPPPAPTLAPPDSSAYADEAVRLINEARVLAGCPAAVPHPPLMQATQDWSEYMEMSGKYHHAPSEYYSNSPFFYHWFLVENIGLSGSPLEIVNGWLSSSIHKSNLEFCDKVGNPEYDPNRIYDIGVGYSGGYWTMVLGWQ